MMVSITIILLIMATSCYGLFEDQVDKWDWKQSFIGEPVTMIPMHLSPSHPSLLVQSKDNVLSSLSLRNGSITWRQVMEQRTLYPPVMDMDLMHVGDDLFGLKEGIEDEATKLISISGGGRYVRFWDSRTGTLKREQTLGDASYNPKGSLFRITGDQRQMMVVELTKSNFLLHTYSLPSLNKDSKVVSVPHLMDPSVVSTFDLRSSCIFADYNVLVCTAVKEPVINIVNFATNKMTSTPLAQIGLKTNDPKVKISVTSLKYNHLISVSLNGEGEAIVTVDKDALVLVKILAKISRISVVPISVDEPVKYAAFALIPKPDHIKGDASLMSHQRHYRIACYDLKTWEEMPNLNGQVIVDTPAIVEDFAILPFIRSKEEMAGYKVWLKMADASIMVSSPMGDKTWTREESMAGIVSTAFVDFPVSESDSIIEEDNDLMSTDLFRSFKNRVVHQVTELQRFMVELNHQILDLLSDSREKEKQREVQGQIVSTRRDYFGFHKMIVILTRKGKLFAVDTTRGVKLWDVYVEGLAEAMALEQVNRKIPIHVQRSANFFPHSAVCTIVTGSSVTSFDPSSGAVLTHFVVKSGVKQVMMMSHPSDNHLKPLIVLTQEDKVMIHPSDPSTRKVFDAQKSQYFMLAVDTINGSFSGHSFGSVTEKDPIASLRWSLTIPVTPSGDIEGRASQHVFTRRFGEVVHSQGRVLGDRNVLYKYLNPNLFAVTNERRVEEDGATGDVKTMSFELDVFLIDSVTGRIIRSFTHKRSKGPVFMVLTENSVIYSFNNEKSRRTEISSIDLYEGYDRLNGTTFSSIDRGSLNPLVEHNTFIFPTGMTAMTDTVTEKGITTKHLIIALPSGALLELPKAFVDPRRPLNPTIEHREEGLIPYIPEVPIPSEGFINYNRTLSRVRFIDCSPSGLESTTLLFSYGLDIFYTRITPSKTFDILKDDFDHVLIAGVLVLLIAAGHITKWMASQKNLYNSWK